MNGINVIGHFHSSIGLGFTARRFRSVLESIDVPVCSISIRREMICNLSDDAEDIRTAEPKYDTNLLIVAPGMVQKLIRREAPSVFKGRRNILVLFWEMADLPDEAIAALSLMDELWVCTKFVAEAAKKRLKAPISLIPHPLEMPEPPTAEAKAPFDYNGRFMFLYVFDFLSGIERKNPFSAVESFKLAFPEPTEGGPLLILKSSHGNSMLTDAALLDLSIEERPDIIHLKEVLPYEQKNALMARADVYLSLHRAEGLGLTILESMAFGRPCIATSYSGNKDICDESNGYPCAYALTRVGHRSVHYDSRSKWAQPDSREAARLMLRAFYNRDEVEAKGKKAAEDVRVRHSFEATGDAIRSAIENFEKRSSRGNECSMVPHRVFAQERIKQAIELEDKPSWIFRKFFRRAHERIQLQFKHHRRALSSILKLNRETKNELQNQIRELRAQVYRLQRLNDLDFSKRLNLSPASQVPESQSPESELEALKALTGRFAAKDPIYDELLLSAVQGDSRGLPLAYIQCAIDLLKITGGRTIVEIGCQRRPITHPIEELVRECCADGHSTFFWGRSGLDVHSVDIDPEAVEVARTDTKDFPNVNVTCGDGIQFIKDFDGTIDLLFLDAWDVVPGSPFAEKHLEAWEVAREKLADTHIIQIDDTDVGSGGKGKLLLPVLRKEGYDIFAEGRQTLAIKLAN
ncbi:MAG: glycosyltransferase [Verrucomicrobiota bacterium]